MKQFFFAWHLPRPEPWTLSVFSNSWVGYGVRRLAGNQGAFRDLSYGRPKRMVKCKPHLSSFCHNENDPKKALALADSWLAPNLTFWRMHFSFCLETAREFFPYDHFWMWLLTALVKTLSPLLAKTVPCPTHFCSALYCGLSLEGACLRF